MSRLKDLRKYVDMEFNKMEDLDKRTSAIAHFYGVSLEATMITKKHGHNPEIVSMAAMLHDLLAYKTCSSDDYAHNGEDLAKEILGELGMTDMLSFVIYN